MKFNSFFYITSYYRSIIAIVASLGLIIYCVSELNETESDFPKKSGVIASAYLQWDKSPYNIKLEGDKVQWYSVYPEKYYPVLKEKAIPGKHAEIWFNPKNNSIKKLVVEGEVLRPYVNSIGVSIGFLIAGSLFLLFNLIYLLRNPSHAKGKPNNS
jgi:hypothetical protein